MADPDRLPDDELVIRFVAPIHLTDGVIDRAAIPSAHFRPPKRISVYAASRTSLEELRTARTDWERYGAAVMSVGDYRRLDFEVELSPDEGDVPAVRHGHASVVGVHSRADRDRLVCRLSDFLQPAPQNI